MRIAGIIRVDLRKGGEQVYECSGANRLWLANKVAINGVIRTNPTRGEADCPIIGIRIADRNNDQLPWGLAAGYMNTFTGDFETLYITVLQNPDNDAELFLNTGIDVAGGYAKVDGDPPIFGAM